VTAGGVGIAKNTYVGGDLVVTGAVSSSGALSFADTTDSTSTSTGSVVTAGGLGVAKAATIGGAVAVTDTTESTTAATGSVTTLGGLGVALNANVGGYLKVETTADATSTITGAFNVAGGAGIDKNLYVGGDFDADGSGDIGGSLSVFYALTVGDDTTIGGVTTLLDQLKVVKSTQSTSPSTGAVTTTGGAGIAKDLHVGGDAVFSGSINAASLTLTNVAPTAFAGTVSVSDTTDSTSASTGSIVTAGGLGVAKSVYIGGTATITDSTQASSASTGSVVTAGGAGVAKNLWVGGSANVVGDIETTGELGVSGNGDIGASLSVFYNLDVGKDTALGGLVTTHDTTDATSVGSASVVVKGGLGVAKKAVLGGVVTVTDTTEASSTSVASVVTAGGVGVAKDVIVGGSVYAKTFTSSSQDMSIAPGGSLAFTVGSGESITMVQGATTVLDVAITGDVSADVAAANSMSLKQGSESRVTLASTGAVTVASDTATDLTLTGGAAVSASSDTGEFRITAGADECAEFRVQQACFYGVTVGGTPTDKLVIDSSGGITLNVVEGQAFTVATERDYSSTDAEVVATNKFLNGYKTEIKKQVTLGSSYTTVGTVRLGSRDSAFVRVVLEGEWSSAPSMFLGEYFIMHNNGAAPEPSVSAARTGAQRVMQAVGDGSTDNAYAYQTGAENSGSGTKDFYIQFATSGTAAPSSVTVTAIITVEGVFTSAS